MSLTDSQSTSQPAAPEPTLPTECVVCYSEFTSRSKKSHNVPVQCEWGCTETLCKSCYLTHFQVSKNLMCINTSRKADGTFVCKKLWTDSYLAKIFGANNKKIDAIRDAKQHQVEISRMPSTMEKVAVIKKREEFQTNIEKLKRRVAKYKRRLAMLRERRRAIRRDRYEYDRATYKNMIKEMGSNIILCSDAIVDINDDLFVAKEELAKLDSPRTKRKNTKKYDIRCGDMKSLKLYRTSLTTHATLAHSRPSNCSKRSQRSVPNARSISAK